MKILQITPYFPPAWSFGGPVRHIYEISKFLVKHGHNVTVFTSNICNPSQYYNKFHDYIDGIEIYRFPIQCGYKGYWITPRLINKIFKMRPDIIHLHSFRNFQCDIGYLFCKLKKIPYLLTAHGTIRAEEELSSKFSLSKLIRRFYDEFIGHHIIHDAARLICVTESEKWHFLSFNSNEDKISIIPNGINTNYFQKNEKFGLEFRDKYNIHDKFILSVGRLNHLKGFDFLINAFGRLINKFPEIKLVIVGYDFGYKKHLQQLINTLKLQNSIIFINKLVGKNLLGAYSAASLYIQPSRYEVFGMAALEAASCGAPVIVTKVGGLKDLFQHGTNGFIVNFNDINSIENISSDLLSNESLSKQIGFNSRKNIEEIFNWDIIGMKLEKLYKNAIGSKTIMSTI